MTLRERIHDRLRRSGAATQWELCSELRCYATSAEVADELRAAIADETIEECAGFGTKRYVLVECLMDKPTPDHTSAAAGAVPVGADRAAIRSADRAE